MWSKTEQFALTNHTTSGDMWDAIQTVNVKRAHSPSQRLATNTIRQVYMCWSTHGIELNYIEHDKNTIYLLSCMGQVSLFRHNYNVNGEAICPYNPIFATGFVMWTFRLSLVHYIRHGCNWFANLMRAMQYYTLWAVPPTATPTQIECIKGLSLS